MAPGTIGQASVGFDGRHVASTGLSGRCQPVLRVASRLMERPLIRMEWRNLTSN